jgi:DNA-binding beta-propeller fold protein YncE
MKLEIVWRNPQPPAKADNAVSRIGADDLRAVYTVSGPDLNAKARVDPGQYRVGRETMNRINSATGVLTPMTPAKFNTTGGSQPLGIAIDPTSMHVYTADVSSISAFNIDPATGALY